MPPMATNVRIVGSKTKESSRPRPIDEQGEEQEQPDRAPAVGANLLLERHQPLKATLTGASAPSPASKNSRGSKRNRRATSSVGNVCWRLLKRSTVAL